MSVSVIGAESPRSRSRFGTRGSGFHAHSSARCSVRSSRPTSRSRAASAERASGSLSRERSSSRWVGTSKSRASQVAAPPSVSSCRSKPRPRPCANGPCDRRAARKTSPPRCDSMPAFSWPRTIPCRESCSSGCFRRADVRSNGWGTARVLRERFSRPRRPGRCLTSCCSTSISRARMGAPLQETVE